MIIIMNKLKLFIHISRVVLFTSMAVCGTFCLSTLVFGPYPFFDPGVPSQCSTPLWTSFRAGVNEELGSLFYFIIICFSLSFWFIRHFCSFVGKITVRPPCVLWPLLAQNLSSTQGTKRFVGPLVSADMCLLAPSWGSLATCDFVSQNISGLVLSTATLSAVNISWQISIIATTWICQRLSSTESG